mmetsp:Transcript_14543/g.31866  ORF Transcript_14543/g.31866 Transcript_14543/m.31866 type:complete len:327 (+) Transcript_14543:62-1042(+)
MPLCSIGKSKTYNQAVEAESEFQRLAPLHDPKSQMRILISAIDYKGTPLELTASRDGNNFRDLATACGAQDITMLYDNMATKENVTRAIREIGMRTGEDDYFIFFYAGHGTQVDDEDHDEEDGQDEAYCFVTPQGELNEDSVMSDDVFAEVVSSSFNKRTRILIISDCCHSGSIADFDRPCWANRRAVSISGCQDHQESGDTGHGGIFTHALLLAVDKLQNHGQDCYSCGMLHNAVLHEVTKVFRGGQKVTMARPPTFGSGKMAWPLLPIEDYTSPLSMAKSGRSFASLGIPPFVSGSISKLTDITAGAEDYVDRISTKHGKCSVM